ncbi:MAG: hypothetical protein KJ052_01945, partial [Candidatus Hydrogenedentes bacterium]|nr:hypothetical protein [Candidatus Hydrogenedentota bacterium]
RHLGDILAHAGLIDKSQLRTALQSQALNSHLRFGEVLVQLDLVKEEIVARALAAQIGLFYVDLETHILGERTIALASKATAQHYRAIPFHHTKSKLMLAMADPLNFVAMDCIATTTGLDVYPVVATSSSIAASIASSYQSV